MSDTKKNGNGNGKKKPNGNGRKNGQANGRKSKPVDKPNVNGRKHYRVKHDWDGIKKRFALSEHNFTQFIAKEKIAKSTAIEHELHKVVKLNFEQIKLAAQELREKYENEFETIMQKVDSEVDGLEGKQQMQAMQVVKEVATRILKVSSGDFIEERALNVPYNSVGDPARISLAASKVLLEVNDKISDAPPPGEVVEWPLSRKFRPFGYQRDFIYDTPSLLKKYNQDIEVFAFVAGIGSGKTFCGAQKFGDLCALNRGCKSTIYAPTYRMLEDSSKRMFLDVCYEKGIPIQYFPSKEKAILWGDTEVTFRSLDNPEHLRGPTLSHAWLDEAGQLQKQRPFDIVKGRVRDPNAAERCTLITTTPDGLGALYDICIENAAALKVLVYRGSTKDNVALPQSYYAGLKAMYDPKFAKQELEGEFLNIFTGQAYWNFNRRLNTIDYKKSPVRYEKEHTLKLVCDFNVAPMCWNIIQTQGDKDFVLDEIHIIHTTTTQSAIEEFIDRYSSHLGQIAVYGDAAHGTAHSTKGSHTDFQIIEAALEKAFPRQTVELRLQHNPRVTDRIAAFNARLKGVDGLRRLFFLTGDKRNKYTIMDLEKVGFLPGTRQIDKKNKELTHHSDGIGYYIEYEYPLHGIRVTQGRS